MVNNTRPRYIFPRALFKDIVFYHLLQYKNCQIAINLLIEKFFDMKLLRFSILSLKVIKNPLILDLNHL